MITLVDHLEATYTEHVNSRGALQRQYDYFGKKSPHQFGPEAFLVDYGPERTTTAHFHSVDQFQIFFGAAGSRYQRHPIPAVELHYADAFVTYGPFSAGEERLKFFTLRPCQGQYKGEMPSERHKLRYQGRRGVHVDLEPHLAATPGGRRIDRHRRHRARSTTGCRPRWCSPVPRPTSSSSRRLANSGAYVCVLSGSVDVGGRAFGPLSLGWVAADDDDAVVLSDGDTPAAVLRMTYPYPPTPEAHDAAPGLG